MEREGGILTSNKAMYYYNLGEENYTKKDEQELYNLIESSSLEGDEERECWEVYVNYLSINNKLKQLQVMQLPLRETIVSEWSKGLYEANLILLKRKWEETYKKWGGVSLKEFEDYYERYKSLTGRVFNIPLQEETKEELNLKSGIKVEGVTKEKGGTEAKGVWLKDRGYYTLDSVIEEFNKLIYNSKKEYGEQRGNIKKEDFEKVKNIHQQVLVAMTIQIGIEKERIH